MWYGTAAADSQHPFFRPAYCPRKRPSKSHPRAESYFYLGPGIDYPSDSLLMLTRANKVVETKDVTWEARLSTGAPLPPLPEVPEQGGTVDLEEAPEPGGTDVYESAPTTPVPVLERRIPHQLRAVSPMTQGGGDSQAESEEHNDSSTVSSEPPESDTSPRADDDASSSDNGAPTPTAILTAARQLGAHMS